MKKFSYVEDYIELINGDRSPETGKIYPLFNSTPPIVSLARYDVSIVGSMSQAVQSGKSLTDKQADLAVKIILKYRKQLAGREIDVSPVENPSFRMPIRTIDRRRILRLDGNYIILQFPFDNKLIDDNRELAKISQGSWKFDGDAKVWRLAVTEANVVAAAGYARNHEFEIDPEFTKLEQLVLDCEAEPYCIKLQSTDLGYTVNNAPDSLLKYINEILDINNVEQLVDHAGILGYEVDSRIEEQLVDRYSARIYNLMINQESKYLPPVDDQVIEDVISYATVTNRWPLYVYEPDLSDRLYNRFVEKYFKQEEIHKISHGKTTPNDTARVIFFHKYNPKWTQPIPLLISSAGIMHGGEKTMLLQRAEKVVYFAADVYNSIKGRRI
jgi:hypothetical protein